LRPTLDRKSAMRGELFLDNKLLLESFQTLVVLLMYAKSLRGLKGRGNLKRMDR